MTRRQTLEIEASTRADMAAHQPVPNDSADGLRARPTMPARVVFLTHYIPLYQAQVLRAIARRVSDFHVLVSTPIEPNRQFQPDWDDLNVIVQKTITLRRRWRHGDSLGGPQFVDPLFVHVPRDTAAQLRRLNPDVVMSLELGARSLGAIRYCRKHDAKCVLCTYMSEHTETNRGGARRRLRRYLIDRADAITFNGPSCQNYLKQLGARPERLYPLPYAADDRTLYRGPVTRADAAMRNRLLFVGQLSERKGVVPMIEQLARYCRERPQRQLNLRIAGDGPLRPVIEQFPVPGNLQLELLGNVPASELGTLMSHCGVCIAPTLADEWLLVVNEALHAGLPVIGSIYAQAVTTLIRDGHNGWQYTPTVPDSLQRSLDRYFDTSDSDLATIRCKCRDSVAERTPSWAAQGAIDAIADLISTGVTYTGRRR